MDRAVKVFQYLNWINELRTNTNSNSGILNAAREVNHHPYVQEIADDPNVRYFNRQMLDYCMALANANENQQRQYVWNAQQMQTVFAMIEVMAIRFDMYMPEVVVFESDGT